MLPPARLLATLVANTVLKISLLQQIALVLDIGLVVYRLLPFVVMPAEFICANIVVVTPVAITTLLYWEPSYPIVMPLYQFEADTYRLVPSVVIPNKLLAPPCPPVRSAVLTVVTVPAS